MAGIQQLGSIANLALIQKHAQMDFQFYVNSSQLTVHCIFGPTKVCSKDCLQKHGKKNRKNRKVFFFSKPRHFMISVLVFETKKITNTRLLIIKMFTRISDPTSIAYILIT